MELMKPKVEQETPSASQMKEEAGNKNPGIRKELRGLPQALLDRLAAKEKARTIRNMTENSEERKELLLLKEVAAVRQKTSDLVNSGEY